MTAVRVFFCEPSGRTRRSLRRYADGPCPGMAGYPNGHTYHNAQTFLDVVPADERSAIGDNWPHDDARWPAFCEGCGRPFERADSWQLFQRTLYVRAGEAQEFSLADAPIGAVWDADWLHDTPWCGHDGRSLICKVPGGAEWMIDGQATNCTLPNDDEHKCWVRHGRPEDGTLHVDKNGKTCSAGAGSIATHNWHGFLHGGVLSEAG